MNVRSALLGDRSSRLRVGGLAVAIPIVASAAFLLEYDVVLSLWLVAAALAIALYAGWSRAGLLAGCAAVFLAILWRFTVPPLIGYARGSMDSRYTPPRVLAYKLYPRGELVEGLTYGPRYALVAAVVLGGLAYLAGTAIRRTNDRRRADG